MANTTRTSELTATTWVAIVLVVIGAVNWGLVGLFGFDLVAAIFGTMSALTRIIYVIVAIAGIYLLAMATRLRQARPEAPAGTPRRAPGGGAA